MLFADTKSPVMSTAVMEMVVGDLLGLHHNDFSPSGKWVDIVTRMCTAVAPACRPKVSRFLQAHGDFVFELAFSLVGL